MLTNEELRVQLDRFADQGKTTRDMLELVGLDADPLFWIKMAMAVLGGAITDPVELAAIASAMSAGVCLGYLAANEQALRDRDDVPA